MADDSYDGVFLIAGVDPDNLTFEGIDEPVFIKDEFLDAIFGAGNWLHCRIERNVQTGDLELTWVAALPVHVEAGLEP